MSEATSGAAWVRHILAFEAALARAEGRAGVIPQSSGSAISAVCQTLEIDPAAIAEAARLTGTPVVPILTILRAALSEQDAGVVHWGATSQDALDTAAMLVSRHAVGLLLIDLHGLAAAAARLATDHRHSVMAGRTVLQHAVPITFGLKAAGWLTATIDAHAGLLRWKNERLALQFGGAAGSLAALGSAGTQVGAYLAEELDLAAPAMPWHTARGRVAELAAAMAVAAGVAGKIALDVILMAQTEVGEVAEPPEVGKGASSAMPQKRNPVGAVATLSAARQAQSFVPLFVASMLQEHERAAGAWQAEWEPLSQLFQTSAAAARGARLSLEGLVVNTNRMRDNVNATGGLIMSESVGMLLSTHVGRKLADTVLADAVAVAANGSKSFRDALLADVRLQGRMTAGPIEAALAPENYLGSADTFIDRAVASYEAMPR
jgi:3-carboxy-cis,cis-muconate cycloisomerase